MVSNPRDARDARMAQGLSWWKTLERNSEASYENAKKSRNAQYNSSLAPVIEKTAGNVKKSAEKAFDIFGWIQENWQLVIVGFVALLVLIKD